tara:strand:+ start:186 stop:587 length:402 start_codon:yes stop_codon:yes gene_type:complete
MGHRTNNLRTFVIAKDNWFKTDLISLFDMDEDYNGGNGDEYWEMSDQVDKNGDLISVAKLEGYETEAERFVDNIYAYSHENGKLNMKQCITSVLYKIEECHGDYSTQFNFAINDLGNTPGISGKFVISISYLT